MSCSYISATQIFFVMLRYVKYIIDKFKIQMQALSFRDYLKLKLFLWILN